MWTISSILSRLDLIAKLQKIRKRKKNSSTKNQHYGPFCSFPTCYPHPLTHTSIKFVCISRWYYPYATFRLSCNEDVSTEGEVKKKGIEICAYLFVLIVTKIFCVFVCLESVFVIQWSLAISCHSLAECIALLLLPFTLTNLRRLL